MLSVSPGSGGGSMERVECDRRGFGVITPGGRKQRLGSESRRGWGLSGGTQFGQGGWQL